MGNTGLDYFIFVFLTFLGALQIIASRSGLIGLGFFRRPNCGYILGLAVIIGAFCWFFISEERNVRDGLLKGSEQFGIATLAIGLAVLVTLTVSSLIQSGIRQQRGGPLDKHGIDIFREMTFFQVIGMIVRRSRKED